MDKTGYYCHKACWKSLEPEEQQRLAWLHRQAPTSLTVNVTALSHSESPTSAVSTKDSTRPAVSSCAWLPDTDAEVTKTRPSALRPHAT